MSRRSAGALNLITPETESLVRLIPALYRSQRGILPVFGQDRYVMQRRLKPFGPRHVVEGLDAANSTFSTSAVRISVPVHWCSLVLLLIVCTSFELVYADMHSCT